MKIVGFEVKLFKVEVSGANYRNAGANMFSRNIGANDPAFT